MDDLDAIRAKRLAELKSQQGGGGQLGQNGNAGEDERRNAMLANILENEARERLNRISIVKPEKAKQVQDLIIRLASTGRISKRVSEKDLIDLLSQTSQQRSQQSVIIQRRRYSDDEDDDF